MPDTLGQIQHLVGPVTVEQLRYVDCFAADHLGIFMPVGGACNYALTEEHAHPAYMFVLAFDNQTKIKLNGKTLSSRPGKIFALSPNIAHTELLSDLPPRYLVLMIDKDFWDEQLRFYPEAVTRTLEGIYINPPADFLPTCRKFMLECQNRCSGSEAVRHAIGMELCHYLIRGIWRIDTHQETIGSRFEINRVVEYIQVNLGKRITGKDMARVACMSPSHFSRVFKKELGSSPHEYLLNSRLIRAKKLLQAGDKTISDIALECGFANPSHFSAKFSKKYNLSPARYRKSIL